MVLFAFVDTLGQLANKLDYSRARVPIGEMFVQHALLHRRQRLNIFLRLISARHQHPSARFEAYAEWGKFVGAGREV